MLVKNAQGQLTEDDHRRAWSYMQLCLAEWRAPWVGMLTARRKRAKSRDAFVEHLEVTPEIFDERWRERILGTRPHMDPLRADTEGTTNEDLTSREREALRRQKDPETLAALVRGLGTVGDPATAQLLIDLLERNNATLRVQGGAELATWIDRLLKNPEEAKEFGRRARETISMAKGATERNFELLEDLFFKCYSK